MSNEKAMEEIVNTTVEILRFNQKHLKVADEFVKDYKSNSGGSQNNILATFLRNIKSGKSIEISIGNMDEFFKLLKSPTESETANIKGAIKIKKSNQTTNVRLIEQKLQYFFDLMTNEIKEPITIDDGSLVSAIISLQKTGELKSHASIVFKCYELIYNNDRKKKNECEKEFQFEFLKKNCAQLEQVQINYVSKFEVATVMTRVSKALGESENLDSNELNRAVIEYSKFRETEYMKKWALSAEECGKDMRRAKDMYSFKNSVYVYRGLALNLQFLIQEKNKLSDKPTLQTIFKALQTTEKAAFERCKIQSTLIPLVKEVITVNNQEEYEHSVKNQKYVYFKKSLTYGNRRIKVSRSELELDDDIAEEIISEDQRIVADFWNSYGENFHVSYPSDFMIKVYLMYCMKEDKRSFKQWVGVK